MYKNLDKLTATKEVAVPVAKVSYDDIAAAAETSKALTLHDFVVEWNKAHEVKVCGDDVQAHLQAWEAAKKTELEVVNEVK